MSYDFPDEKYDEDYNKGGHKNLPNPFFTGRGSGKLNRAYCKLQPQNEWCHWKNNPKCYNIVGRWNGKCKYPKGDQKLPYPKYKDMPGARKRKFTKRRGGRTKKRVYKRRKRAAKSAKILKGVSVHEEGVVHQFIINGNQNQKQFIIGTEQLSWGSIKDLQIALHTNPSGQSETNVWVGDATIDLTMQNLAPNKVVIGIWKLTPRYNNYIDSITPQGIFNEGLISLGVTVTNQTSPFNTMYSSKMLNRNFIVRRVKLLVLENGEEKHIHLKKKWNKTLNFNRLTTVGGTTIPTDGWLKGFTEFFAITTLGGLHDVKTAGTDGVTGMGYGPSRVGCLLRKNYKSAQIDAQDNSKVIPSTALLGVGGTGTGGAQISNEDTGIALNTWSSGAVANQA